MNNIKCEHPLTYHDFFEKFNSVSLAHYASLFTAGGVVVGVAIIADYDDSFKAFLGLEDHAWSFNDSSFDWGELDLMAQLAASQPEIRGEVNNAD